jgi:hypothetical protein
MDTDGGMRCETTEASWPVAEPERLSGTQAHRLMRSDEEDEAQYIQSHMQGTYTLVISWPAVFISIHGLMEHDA